MHLRRSALSFLLLTGLSLALLSPARAAEDTSAADDGHVTGRAFARHLADDLEQSRTDVPSSAHDELDEVQELFDPKTAQPGTPSLAEGGDATLPLRDLAVADPGAAGRSGTYATYQRPWDDDNGAYKRDCRANVCVHWLSRNDPRYAGKTDAAWDSFAEDALDTLVSVSAAYSRAGYRKPKPDGPRPDGQPMYGGSSATDVYLANVGRSGLYGYCTVDRNDDGSFTYAYQIRNTRRSDLPAFCVLDNDFSKRDFPTRRTSAQDLQVTAAHEYFHAVQFAYDFLEDRWFMEASATWAEDQVYTRINDNLQYLRSSPLTHPRTALDRSVVPQQYGDWIFLRYLTERVPTPSGGMPYVMRRAWEYADSVKGPDYYSIRAIKAALASRGVRDFPKLFARFEAANRHPATSYREGRANHYPTARPARTVRLSKKHRSASGSPKVAHLAAATIRVTPKHVRRGRLAITVDLPDKRTGSRAVATIFYKNGRIATKVVKTGREGGGRLSVRGFTSRRIAAVDLTLANANTRYTRCWTNTVYSCSGRPSKPATEHYSVKLK